MPSFKVILHDAHIAAIFVDYTVGGVPNQHRQVTGAIFAIYVTFLLRSVKEVWRNKFYVIKMQA